MAKPPAKSASVPAPIGGWDTENALADMPTQNAVILDNWFPETDEVTLRRGFDGHASGLTGDVETLLAYSPEDGGQELFAANNGAIYDVTTAGAIGAAEVSSLSNDRWQYVNVSNSGGSYLRAVNGEDTPLLYDGTSWTTTPAITGPTAANLVWINLHQRRLWFGERDSMRAWYLDVNAISGAASSFDLGGVARLGGYIMAMGTWTFDAGDGADDAAVFLTSEGEAIVYQGTDPSSADTWSLVGVFRIGKPIGRRCMIKDGADLIMVTEDGFVAASQILSVGRSQADARAISTQINRAVNDAVRLYKSTFGWEPFIYPRGRMLLFNVPQAGATRHQYVFNSITRRPCRFTGVNAVCWALFNDEAYFGGDGAVYKFDTGTSDDGAEINGDALQAFSYFKSPASKKSFKMVELVLRSTGTPNIAIDLNTDFQIKAPSGVPAEPSTSAARWGISKWGKGLWGTSGQVFRAWRGVRGAGRAASLRVRTSTTTARPSWVATNWIYIPGGML